MKKVLSVALAAVMLFSLAAVGFASEYALISPEAESRFVQIVLKTGSGKRIIVPEEDMNGYYILLYSEETENARIKNIYHTLYPNGEESGIVSYKIPEVFGADYSDFNLLSLFRVERVGTPTEHNTVEFSLFVPNAVDSNSYKLLAEVNNEWKYIEISSLKNGIFTFEVSYDEAVTNYAILYKRSSTSPKTGMDASLMFLLPAAVLCAFGCVYTGKKYLFA